MGIMNGTTNFMLCKMEDEGAQYGAALKEAQVRKEICICKRMKRFIDVSGRIWGLQRPIPPLTWRDTTSR